MRGELNHQTLDIGKSDERVNQLFSEIDLIEDGHITKEVASPPSASPSMASLATDAWLTASSLDVPLTHAPPKGLATGWDQR